MITTGIKKYIINPSLGLLVGVLYFTLFLTTGNIFFSLIFSLVFSGIADLNLRIFMKTNICGLAYLLNFCALGLTLIVYLLTLNEGLSDLFFLVLYEVLFVCALFFVRISKTYLTLYLSKNKSIIQKTFLGEFFEVAKLGQYAITFHLFLQLIYRYVEGKAPAILSFSDTLFYFILPIILLSVIVVYEEMKTRNIVKHLRKEEWLPIVNESGKVTGRVARSVSAKMKNRFMHPVVRVALVYNGELYLQQRSAENSLDPLMYDHPFEKYMLFNHEINIAVRNSISYTLGMQELPFKFLIKYVFENAETNRLIFLFVSRIETKEQLESIAALNGKFWSIKQIEESFKDDNIFSECFQLEFEYLKNVVLQSEMLRNAVNM